MVSSVENGPQRGWLCEVFRWRNYYKFWSVVRCLSPAPVSSILCVVKLLQLVSAVLAKSGEQEWSGSIANGIISKLRLSREISE